VAENPIVVAAAVTDFYKIKKVSNCTERVFLKFDANSVQSLCANNVKHDTLVKGKAVLLKGRGRYLGFSVDEIVSANAPLGVQ
jgi:hypothetical protein